MQLDMETLAAQAVAGDRPAMEQLFESIYPLIYRFHMKLCRHPGEAQEHTQAAMLHLVENLHKYRAGPGRFHSWAFKLSYNLFVDHKRRRTVAPMEDALLQAVADPRDSTREAELRDETGRLLAVLPEEQRAIVVLRYYLDQSYEEIARALGISEKRVKWRLHDAMEKMRRNGKEAEVYATAT